MTAIRELFDLPQQVHQGDFVVELASGVAEAEKTARSYVVTPKICDAFDLALGLVSSSIQDGRSRASYLHGSFGSGKSHFMAMLSLMLDGSEVVWGLGKLHGLRIKHPNAGTTKLLQLRLHMIGASGLESKLFGSYLDYLTEHHPKAAVPPLFADAPLFDNAREMLNRMGDEAFFAGMGQPDGDWGQFASGWNRERFELHAGSSDPTLRAELFDELVKHLFPSYVKTGAYVSMDEGLAVMARHAKGLGYQGIVLFLDELILWLSHKASEGAWLHNEVQKMVKLVEGQDGNRELPIVSFIARQRDLAEMVGKMHTGAENALLHDSLAHWAGRFGEIRLEDTDLPAIVEERILRPKGDEARQALDAAFKKLQQSAGSSWNTLLANQDRDAFRKLYPFSPALVDGLVALSNTLQRQRTAIKLLMELLVEHLADFSVGDLVGVGDLFDVLAGGEEPADGVMRSRFKAAKELYKYHLLPVIRDSNGTNGPERCQRERAEHPVRLGCSGCGERACRTDNRLVKTLLIAALVPNVDVLRDLTASRLYQLNHGSLKAAFAGTEVSLVVGKLRKWGAVLASLQIGKETDPKVAISLEGVDLRPILKAYEQEDSHGARIRVLRELLFDALQFDKTAETGKVHNVKWRGTERQGRVQFGNVRVMNHEMLRCAEGEQFRLIVDFPFDETGKGPNDDLRVLEDFKESGGSWSVAWVPHFFTPAITDLLGDLAILDHILQSGVTLQRALEHLSADDRNSATSDLRNLYNQKRVRLLSVMKQAYGFESPQDDDIESSKRVDRHLYVLRPGAQELQPGLAAGFDQAVDSYVAALLERRYPRHPEFPEHLTANLSEDAVEWFGRLVQVKEGYLGTDKDQRRRMLASLGALGLVRASETALHLFADKVLQPLENRRAQLGIERPTVGQFRDWLDPEDKMGLEWRAEDLVVRCYAIWSCRTLELDGRPYVVTKGKAIANDVVLEKPPLPGGEAWESALVTAGACFGGTGLSGRYLSPDNVNKLRTLLDQEASKLGTACDELPVLLTRRLAELGLTDDEKRLRTARDARGLLADLRGKSAINQVLVLAMFTPQSSAEAVGKHLFTAKSVLALLNNNLLFATLAQLAARASEIQGGSALLDKVRSVLRQDELVSPCLSSLNEAGVEAQRLLSQGTSVPPKKPDPIGEVLIERKLNATNADAARKALDELIAELEKAVSSGEDDVSLVGQVSLIRRKGK